MFLTKAIKEYIDSKVEDAKEFTRESVESVRSELSESETASAERLQEFGRQFTLNFEELLAGKESQLKEEIQTIFEKAFEEDRRRRYESEEPFVEIVSQTFDEESGIQLRLDWNQPFIKYLKKHGFTGNTDEAIVDSWLFSLSREKLASLGHEFD